MNSGAPASDALGRPRVARQDQIGQSDDSRVLARREKPQRVRLRLRDLRGGVYGFFVRDRERRHGHRQPRESVIDGIHGYAGLEVAVLRLRPDWSHVQDAPLSVPRCTRSSSTPTR